MPTKSRSGDASSPSRARSTNSSDAPSKAAARSTDSAGTALPGSDAGDAALKRAHEVQQLAAAVPFNATKSSEHGAANGVATPPGATVDPASRLATGSTLSEAASDDKVGTQAILIAGAVYGILQVAKKYLFPNLKPVWLVTLNAIMSIAGALSVTPLAQFWTIDTLEKVILIIATAAGIHGTARSLVMGGDTTPSDKAKAQQAAKSGTAVIIALCIGLALAPMAGCAHRANAPLPAQAVDAADANANQVLQTVQAFSSRVSADIISGKIRVSDGVKNTMETLNKSYNKAYPIEQAYHNAGGGNAGELAAAIQAVKEAFSSAQSVVAAATIK